MRNLIRSALENCRSSLAACIRVLHPTTHGHTACSLSKRVSSLPVLTIIKQLVEQRKTNPFHLFHMLSNDWHQPDKGGFDVVYLAVGTTTKISFIRYDLTKITYSASNTEDFPATLFFGCQTSFKMCRHP